jgi:hypothetical protein
MVWSQAVADAVSLAHATRRINRQDLGWAFGYNLLLVSLAAAGTLPPVRAALAMATSSVTSSATRCGGAASAKQADTGARHPPRHGHPRGVGARRDTSQRMSPAIAGLTPPEPALWPT